MAGVRSIPPRRRGPQQPIVQRVFLAITCLAALLTVHTAEAQPFLQVAPPSGKTQSTPHSAAYCKQSPLNGLAFLKLMDIIIKHGDLTDVAFIQKHLGASFSASRTPALLTYQSNQMHGAPIHLDLTLSVGPQQKGDKIAYLSFDENFSSPPAVSFIPDCLHMTAYDFSAFFGPGFGTFLPTAGWPPGPPTSADSIKALSDPGKNGSTLQVEISYDTSSLTVSHISIVQRQ